MSLLGSLVHTLRWFDDAVLFEREGVNLHLRHPKDGSQVCYNGVTDIFETRGFSQELVNPSELLALTASFNLRHIFRKRLLHFGCWPVAIIWLVVFTWGALVFKFVCQDVLLPLMRQAKKAVVWIGNHVVKPLFIQLRKLIKCLYLNIVLRPLKALWRCACWAYTQMLLPLLQQAYSSLCWFMKKVAALANWVCIEIGSKLKAWCIACYRHVLVPFARALKQVVVFTWEEVLVPAYKFARYCACWLHDTFKQIYRSIRAALVWLWTHSIVVLADIVSQCVHRLWVKVLVPMAKMMWRACTWVFNTIVTESFKLCLRATQWTWANILRPSLNAFIDVMKWIWLNVVERLWHIAGRVLGWIWHEVVKRGVHLLKAVCSWLWNEVVKKALAALGDVILWLWRYAVLALFSNLYKALKYAYTSIQPLLRWLKVCIIDIEKAVARLFQYAWARVIAGVTAIYSVFAYLYRWIISWANREAISDLEKLEKETK